MSSLTRGQRRTMLIAVLAAAGAGVGHFAGMALAALASIVSFATEQVGARFGPAVTGFLQSKPRPRSSRPHGRALGSSPT